MHPQSIYTRDIYAVYMKFMTQKFVIDPMFFIYEKNRFRSKVLKVFDEVKSNFSHSCFTTENHILDAISYSYVGLSGKHASTKKL